MATPEQINLFEEEKKPLDESKMCGDCWIKYGGPWKRDNETKQKRNKETKKNG